MEACTLHDSQTLHGAVTLSSVGLTLRSCLSVQVPAEFSAEKLDQVGDAFDFSPEARRAELKKAEELKEEAALQEWYGLTAFYG